MNKTSKSQQKHNQSHNQNLNSTLNNNNKKQFPSISLTKHLQDYKAYRSIDNRKKFPDIDKTNIYNISPEDKSLLIKNSQVPSIHNANDIMNGFQSGYRKIQKLQCKVLKNLLTTKKEEQWKLYMTKSELMQENHGHSQQFDQIEEYLLRFINKLVEKNCSSQMNGSKFNFRSSENQQEEDNQNINVNKPLSKFNKTVQHSILQSIQLNKKSSQPSLRILKDQLNTLNASPRQNSSILTPQHLNLNKTAIGFGTSYHHPPPSTTNKPNTNFLIQNLEQQLNKSNFQKSVLQKKIEHYQLHINKLEAKLREENIQLEDNQQGQENISKQQMMNKLLAGNGSDEVGNLQNDGQTTTRKKPHNHHKDTSQQLMLKNLISQNKYKSQAQFKKIQNQTLTRQLNIIKQFSFKLKSQNASLLTKLQFLEQQCKQCRQYKKYKQLWLMQCEEMIGWKDLWKDKKEENQKLVNKIKILKEKNKQLLHSFNFSMVVNPDQEEDKQELEVIIKGFQEWLKVISVPRVNCPSIDPKALLNSQSIKEQQYLPDPENLNYKLLKPNFFIFFEAYQKTIMMEKNILNTRPLQPTFFVKIRAIFDSMYNHFNSYSHYKHWSSFPQFVIGFLEKYEINHITLKIQPRKKPMSSQEKLTFLMNLFNKKLSNTWQCQMFRSFILEEYSLDEIYFFLDCRNDLNGGSTLTHGLGILDPVSYVKLHKALYTTQKKLSPYENHIIERVRNIIKSRKKQKNGQQFIDRHFVLKLLLQVYSLQKIKSQRIFQASFKTKNVKKQIVSYSDFYSFMYKNFQFLSSIQICQLYRQTYSLASGKITYKTVHYICLSKGLFIPLIWTKRLNMNILDKSFNNDMILLDLQNSSRKMNTHLVHLGVQQASKFQNDLNLFLRQLDWYRNNKQVFYFKLQQIKLKIIRSNCLLNWQNSTYTPNQMLTSDQIREGILQLHHLIQQSNSSTHFLSRKKQQEEKAYKLLTRNFKIRIQQSMNQFKRVDQEQLNKLKQQVALEIKMREIRLKNDQKQAIMEQLLTGVNHKKQKPMIGNSLINVANLVAANKRNANLQAKSNIIEEETSNENIKKQKNSSSKKLDNVSFNSQNQLNTQEKKEVRIKSRKNIKD